jgi:hypothetical protein
MSHTCTVSGVAHDVYRLWEVTADMPTTKVPVSKLRWILDKFVWGVVTPNMVIAYRDAGDYPDDIADVVNEEIRRIEEADLSYPPLLYRLPADIPHEYSILDGVHRLMKWLDAGVTEINVIVVDDDTLQQARREP